MADLSRGEVRPKRRKTSDEDDIKLFGVLPDEAFVRIHAVCLVSGLKKTAIYKSIKLGRFPKPCRLTDYAVGWRVGDVRQYLKDLAAGTDATANATPRASAIPMI